MSVTIHDKYRDLDEQGKVGSVESDTPGLVVSPGYPGMQVSDLTQLVAVQLDTVVAKMRAASGERPSIEISGNNNAFFLKGDEASRGHMRTVMEAAYRDGVDVTLAVDRRLLEDPEAFVAAYEGVRGELTEAERREILGGEVVSITDYLQNGGLREDAEAAVRAVETERGAVPGEHMLQQRVDGFVGTGIRVIGIEPEEEKILSNGDVTEWLPNGAWRVTDQAGEAVLLATQRYPTGTPEDPGVDRDNREWTLGTGQAVEMARDGHPRAEALVEAVERRHEGVEQGVDFTHLAQEHERINPDRGGRVAGNGM